MKTIFVLAVYALLSLTAQGQRYIFIPPMELSITDNKTSHLLFPYSITSVSLGSGDVLAQITPEADSVLQVKAARPDILETNMSVITADGKFYSFTIQYENRPAYLSIHFKSDGSKEKGTMEMMRVPNPEEIENVSQWVRQQSPFLSRIKDRKYGMGLRLQGLYIDRDIFYYQYELDNRTHINYDIELLRVFIKDRKQSKRTASQEVLITPLLVSGNIRRIDGKSRQCFIVAVKKFTIPDQKKLIIQLMELNGGRHLQLFIGNKTIVRAKPI